MSHMNHLRRKALREAPRAQAVQMVHLMTDHSLLKGHQLRLARKKALQTFEEPEHKCRRCDQVLEDLQHLLGRCQDPTAQQAFKELKTQIPLDDPRHLMALGMHLAQPENFKIWVNFFRDLALEL
eukprot:TRINITY_DN10033_c0_g1_i1.p1 TRINITY_DN10033_c0_g1~~TRINITY_DN10033_c0_g1_i1.p1  ORF type:complete len:125 (+),score=20.57 TRINITY_DN10033_c0_g1_i1:310-684(+)